MKTPEGHRYYRIVQSNPPTETDFWSHERLGKPLRNPQQRSLWEGISVFATFRAAREKAMTYPDKGKWIAELAIPRSPNVQVEQTGSRRSGHHTIWADPGVLLECVVGVEPVEGL